MIPVESCQRQNWLADHPWWRRHFRNAAGLRKTLRWLLRGRRGRPSYGAPSRFPPGAWVRVRDATAIRSTLDPDARLRGLWFTDLQWDHCGKVFRVLKPVRRIMDDLGHLRSVSKTLLLEGVDCSGNDHSVGCGRECPLLFRDEWLEEAPPPPSPGHVPLRGGEEATVRSVEEIEGTLDLHGRRGRLTFMAEMAAFAGQRFRVNRKLEWVFEDDRRLALTEPIYLLQGLRCSGSPIGAGAPCDRGCGLLWHGDWLRLESRAQPTASPSTSR